MKSAKRKIVRLCLMLVMMLTVPAIVPNTIGGTITAEAATKVGLNVTKSTLIKGQTLQLKVTGTSKKVRWTTSKKSVVAVNSKGKVTAKGKGTAVITAKVGVKQYKCRITVETPAISKSSMSLIIGNTQKLKVTGTSQKITWNSSNKNVATVNQKGVVKAIEEGNATITAQIGKKSFKCRVTVKEEETYGSVSGNITYYYNAYRGNVPDIGAYVLLIPADGSAKKLDFVSIYIGDEKNHIYQAQVDGKGEINISHVASGRYFAFIVSKNTNSEEYYEYIMDEITESEFLEGYTSWLYPDYVSKKVANSIAESASIGGKKCYGKEITVYEGETSYISYDFGMTYF